MTIITTQARVTYAGDNVSTLFPVPFEFFLNSDLTVVKTAVGGGVATLVLGVDYALTNAGVISGGSLTKTTALLTGETMAIFLNPPIEQESHYISNGPFPASTLENDIDRQTQISQRLSDQISRAIRAPDGDPSAIAASFLLPSYLVRANTNVGFDGVGNLSLNQTLSAGTLSAASIGTFITPQTPGEAAVGVTIVSVWKREGVASRYGILPNNAAFATANTAALRQLASYKLHATGWTGKVVFENTTGSDVYYTNDFVDLRAGVSIDLQGCTLQCTKSAATGNENNSGAIMAIRDSVIENGTINLSFAAGSGTGCTALFLGARGTEGSFYNPFYDAVYLAATGRTLGNITVRNMYITTNGPGLRCISALGGLQDVLFENVWTEGQSVADGFYAEYGFATDGGGVSTSRQSSHGNNIRFVNFKATNLLTTGVAIGYNGAYAVSIQGLRVIGQAASAYSFGFGEAYYYQPWTGQDGSQSNRRTVTIRDVIAKNLLGSGGIIQGAGTSSVAGGYLSTVINALGTPALYKAQSDMVSATIDGFAMNGTSAGNAFQIIGAERVEICNGRAVGFGHAVNFTAEVTQYNIHDCTFLDSTGTAVQIGAGFPVWSPARFSVGRIDNCFIAGSTGAALSLLLTDSCMISNNRFGYETAHDGQAETTQTSAVVAGATCAGVVCESNNVGGSTSTAYSLSGSLTSDNGCFVNNPQGITTIGGAWGINGVSTATATQIATAAAQINTANKYIYKRCIDGSNHKLYIARGPAATDIWDLCDGSASVTPS